MPQLKVKHGSFNYDGVRYGVGIHTLTDATPVDVAAEAWATSNPTAGEYTATTFTGAAATVYSAEIYKLRSLQPEIGGLLTRQQKNQALYETARQTKGRGPDEEFMPLVETAGDFDAIDHDDPAFTGEAWRQGDLPTDPGERQQLAAPSESSVAGGEGVDVSDAVYNATVGETVHQPTGTTKGTGDPEEEAKAEKKASKEAAKAEKKAEKDNK